MRIFVPSLGTFSGVSGIDCKKRFQNFDIFKTLNRMKKLPVLSHKNSNFRRHFFQSIPEALEEVSSLGSKVLSEMENVFSIY